MDKTHALHFDFSTCYGDEGLSPASLAQADATLREAISTLRAQVERKALGFWQLPERYLSVDLLAPVENQARWIQGNFENLVIIGIGGSALGARMIQNALAHRYHNELPAETRQGVRLYLLENNDPDSLNDLVECLNLEKTLFNVVSKSGSTVETAAQFVLVRDLLRSWFPETWKEHLLYTTDPESGIMRRLSLEEGIRTLEVPSDVGGRYSVLSPVGLLPALALRMDARALLTGARDMAARCFSEKLEENPALEAAAIHFLADRELNKNMVVAFPYADRLRDWTEWFCQLWAESIGKERNREGERVHAGTTPVRALGAIDQHSQSQLYMEGPDDKLFMFLRVEQFSRNSVFPPEERIPEDFRYLAGHDMAELIKAEQTATRFALGKRGRLNYQVTLPRLDAYTLGQLIFWAEATTVLAGYIYGVDPFDQPGVELSKNYAYGLMGRAGFERFREEIEEG